MNSTLSRWPDWLRWVLLLPASILGGFLAGAFIEIINIAEAARPKAPVFYIAAFLGSLAATWSALYVARVFAPSHKKVIGYVLLAVAILGSLSTVYPILVAGEYHEFCRTAGMFVGCFVFWREFLRKMPFECITDDVGHIR